jgi:hypothetical protein
MICKNTFSESIKLKIYFKSVFLLLLLVCPSNESRSDQVGPEITATGEGSEVDWKELVFCNSGTFVIGYRQRVEDSDPIDDTALNSIEMSCADYDGNDINVINSHGGFWGDWYEYKNCPNLPSEKNFMSGYKILKGPESTGAHGMKGRCLSVEEIEAPGQFTKEPGNWGSWGVCSSGTAVCGFQTKMEDQQGTRIWQNDSALNHIRIVCCRMCDYKGGQFLSGNTCGMCHFTCKTCFGKESNQCSSCFFKSNHVHFLSSSNTCIPSDGNYYFTFIFSNLNYIKTQMST